VPFAEADSFSYTFAPRHYGAGLSHIAASRLEHHLFQSWRHLRIRNRRLRRGLWFCAALPVEWCRRLSDGFCLHSSRALLGSEVGTWLRIFARIAVLVGSNLRMLK
jgi:hypothetical protein